ncbi:MAG: hypothetical protein M1840_001246 [Geoglossum simile]|nr:MAG: hypothetical protein M1840_001246 [Geoglossum simile]
MFPDILSTFDSASLLFVLLSASLVSGAPTTQALSRRAFTHYQAFGDSYSAAPGAGQQVVGGEACWRHDGGYPYKLYALLNNGARLPDTDIFSCTGDTAQQIERQAFFMDGNADLVIAIILTALMRGLANIVPQITISLGGNNVGFGNVVNSCVYRFGGPIRAVDCDVALDDARSKIAHELDGPVEATLKTFLSRSTNDNLKMYVTGYAKFWNAATTQCDGVSWQYWLPSTGDKMTQDRRRQMNTLVDQVNTRLANVVAGLNNPKIHFVDYDALYNGNRFCEEGVIEPQKNGEDRPNLHMHQVATEYGQIKPEPSLPGAEPASSWARDIIAVRQAHPDAAPVDAYANLSTPDSADLLPLWMTKVFHPTQLGHSKIAQAVHDAIGDSPVGVPSGGFQPLPADKTATCGGNLGLNFPPKFALLDKQAPASEILFRMRDQACQGKCESIAGVPANLMAAKKVSDNGCEYAAKISSGRELYFYATSSGDNCYKATERMINNCMADKNDGNPIHDSSWINGPNYGEFYQVGVRTLNDPKAVHDPINTGSGEHLGYTHVECKRDDNVVYNTFHINLSNWDDGNWGRSILEKVKECHLSPTEWKYEPGSDGEFADGTKSDHWASFHLVISNGGCAESKIEEAMGLRGGGLDCPINSDYKELDLMA